MDERTDIKLPQVTNLTEAKEAIKPWPGVVIHALYLSTWEAEAYRSLEA